MKEEKKKFMRSPVTIACYIIAALMLIFFATQFKSAWDTGAEYYNAYELEQEKLEIILYAFQSALTSLLFAFVAFIGGFGISEVRKTNPENYKTAEELMAAKEARLQKKEERRKAANSKTEGENAWLNDGAKMEGSITE